MGLASLTGWDPAIVERASGRCAELFGENMLFRTFHEGNGKDGNESSFTEHLAAETDDTLLVDGEELPSQSDEEELNAVRASKPCESCRTSKSQCQPANGQAGNSRLCKECEETGIECTGIRVSSLKHARICPHKSCPRHTIPFHKQYHLQRHLDTMHATTARSASRSRSVSAPARDFYTTDSEVASESDAPDSTYQIVCPVQGCRRSIEPFSTGKRLYEHIRRMHPDVDINAVKRLASRKRGERRGKWRDERRHRSKSRGKSQSRGVSQGRSQSPSQTQHRQAARSERRQTESDSGSEGEYQEGGNDSDED